MKPQVAHIHKYLGIYRVSWYMLPVSHMGKPSVLTSHPLYLPSYVCLRDSRRGANEQVTQLRGH